MNKEKTYTPPEAAKLVGCNVSLVYHYIRKNSIEHVSVPKSDLTRMYITELGLSQLDKLYNG